MFQTTEYVVGAAAFLPPKDFTNKSEDKGSIIAWKTIPLKAGTWERSGHVPGQGQ